jgi:hypothetical protein
MLRACQLIESFINPLASVVLAGGVCRMRGRLDRERSPSTVGRTGVVAEVERLLPATAAGPEFCRSYCQLERIDYWQLRLTESNWLDRVVFSGYGNSR